MGRPLKTRHLNCTEIEAALAEQVAQKALLESDLREVLLAGEETRSYRAALAEIGKAIAVLSLQRAALQESEANQRQADVEVMAVEHFEGARRRFSELMASLQPPAFSLEDRNF